MLETTITVERTAEVLIRSDSGAGFDSLMAACRTLTNSPESLSTRVNESAAVEVAHKVHSLTNTDSPTHTHSPHTHSLTSLTHSPTHKALRGRMTQRLQCVRYIGQHKATSPAAPSLTALLQGGISHPFTPISTHLFTLVLCIKRECVFTVSGASARGR